ncbi:MAG: selenoneine synthase SenA [Planctomycetota bacterium]
MNRAEKLIGWMRESHQRLLNLCTDLSTEQLMGPYLPTINPMRWEIGHAAWFYGYWILRQNHKLKPFISNEDDLFMSVSIAHTTRWDLPLPSFEDTVAYTHEIHDAVAKNLSDEDLYFLQYSIMHEDMHIEAFHYMRQTLGYPTPNLAKQPCFAGERLTGDADIPGGIFLLGANPDIEFCFDNEKWAHEVDVQPFSISKTAVSQGQFLKFVEDSGYNNPDNWDTAGWAWRQSEMRSHPIYWREIYGQWQRRHFDKWLPLEPDLAVIHVSWYEAGAYCKWAKRRLPTEPEWAVAAEGEPDSQGNLASTKRIYPWGDSLPTGAEANTDSRAIGCVSVHDHPAGDSAFGVRGLIGNVWEWTATAFDSFPGFTPDMYDEYSAPWFQGLKILRGGAYCTSGRLARSGFRNYYTPNRNDIMAGFRTCAL